MIEGGWTKGEGGEGEDDGGPVIKVGERDEGRVVAGGWGRGTKGEW